MRSKDMLHIDGESMRLYHQFYKLWLERNTPDSLEHAGEESRLRMNI